MLEAIISILGTMGWLGIILGILVMVNIVTKTLNNVWSNKEAFCWSKMFRGIGKSVIFYICAVSISVAFTMLPFINEMIIDNFGIMLLSKELLDTLSAVGVLGVVISAIITHGKKALEGIIGLSTITTNTEEVTWKVEDE